MTVRVEHVEVCGLVHRMVTTIVDEFINVTCDFDGFDLALVIGSEARVVDTPLTCVACIVAETQTRRRIRRIHLRKVEVP